MRDSLSLLLSESFFSKFFTLTQRGRRNGEHAFEKIKKKSQKNSERQSKRRRFRHKYTHKYIHIQHAIHCPSPKRPKDQRRLHRQGRQRKVHDGLETARQQVSTLSVRLGFLPLSDFVSIVFTERIIEFFFIRNSRQPLSMKRR